MNMNIETQIARSAEIIATDVINAGEVADMESGIQISVMIERNSAGEVVWVGAELGIVPNATHHRTACSKGDLIACGRDSITFALRGLISGVLNYDLYMNQAGAAVAQAVDVETINPATDYVFTETKDASDPAFYAPKAFKSARGAAKQLVWDMYSAVNNAVRERGTEVSYADAHEIAFTWRVRAYRVSGVNGLAEVYVAYLGEASKGYAGETIIAREFDDEDDMVDQIEDAILDYAIWDESFNQYADRARCLVAA